MENVVYLLGAGFSAPLGLPVMSNFMEKAKDLYFGDPKKYAHFKKIFSRIENMSYVKNFYNTNLLNIEEILSILEMEKQISDKYNNFKRLIIDVINAYTPKLPQSIFSSPTIRDASMRSAYGVYSNMFSSSSNWQLYSSFILSLFQANIYIQDVDFNGRIMREVNCGINKTNEYNYSIITLNYDLVPETICQIINCNFDKEQFRFNLLLNANNPQSETICYLAKLHGSVDTNEIIPPTWNKGLTLKGIKKAWKIAYELLKKAQQIRIIGYSLPVNDSYIKYLLRSAILENNHMKRIDIICKDDRNQSFQKRYFDFIEFENKRFVNKGIEDFLQKYNSHIISKAGNGTSIYFNELGNFHSTYFDENISWLK